MRADLKIKCSVILHMFDKINDRIKDPVVTSARSPNTTSESRPQLIHHYAPLQFIPVNTHNMQQDRQPASVCLNIPCIRHAGMLTSLCTIVNVCLCPPPFFSLPYCVCGHAHVCVCVCGVSKRAALFKYDFVYASWNKLPIVVWLWEPLNVILLNHVYINISILSREVILQGIISWQKIRALENDSISIYYKFITELYDKILGFIYKLGFNKSIS